MKKWKGLVLLLGLISACSVGIAPKQKVKEETFSLAISYGVTKDVWPSFNSFYNVTNVVVSTIEDGTLFWKTNEGLWFPVEGSLFVFSMETNALVLKIGIKKGDVFFQTRTNILFPSLPFASSLVYEGTWSISGQQVRGILYQDGKIYCVLDNTIRVYSTNGTLVTNFGTGSFMHYITFVDGRFYVTDYSQNRVFVYSTNYTLLFQWGGYGSGNGFFDRCSGITTDTTNIYVVDQGNKRISVFTTNGNFLYNISTAPAEARNVRVEGGRIYVSLFSSPHIRVYTPSGTLVTSWDHPTMVGSDIALVTNGKVYIVDWANSTTSADHIYVYTTNGVLLYVTNMDSNDILRDPHNLCFDAYGRLYLSEFGRVRVFRSE